MGLAIYTAVYYEARQVLGWILVAASLVAGVDGWVCYRFVGMGQGGHWGYAPVLAAVGAELLAVADGNW